MCEGSYLEDLNYKDRLYVLMPPRISKEPAIKVGTIQVKEEGQQLFMCTTV